MTNRTSIKAMIAFASAIIFALSHQSANSADTSSAYIINNAECKKNAELGEYIGMFSKSFTKEDAVKECTDWQMERYNKKLPNYATHTNKEVEAYNHMASRRSQADKKKTSDKIALSCMSIYNLYDSILKVKLNGKSKESVIHLLRKMESKADDFGSKMLYISDLPYNMVTSIYAYSGVPSADKMSNEQKAYYEACVYSQETVLNLNDSN